MRAIDSLGSPSRIAAAVSRAITFAWAGEISPVASAEQVFGRVLTNDRAISILYCAEFPDIRSAAETSSRSAPSTPSYIPSASLGSAPATATIAR